MAVALASFATVPREAQASAPAWSGTDSVHVTEEAAVLVWEAETKVEHLIRSVTFEGAGRTFAYLVPVPSTPVVAEADETIFEQLERFWQQRRPSDTTYSYGGIGSALLSPPSAPMRPEPPVQVLASTRVAGLDTAVLDGHSFVAIGDWLRQNGFEYREELSSWLEPYVRAGYQIVAFKYAKDAAPPRVGSRAVRLSFSTPRPFYPYRQPSDAGATPRTLRLYAVGATSLEASLGNVGPWGAGVRYSGPLRNVHLPFSRLLTPWATFYEEVTPRSSSGDLFLRATAAPRLVQATPRVVHEAVMVPVELLALLLVGGAVGVVLLRRGKIEDEELAEQE
jgi:Uncharacterized protein conserved in bacteria (DUF2330)